MDLPSGLTPNLKETTMASFDVNESATGAALMKVLMAEDIEPGADPSYELCKLIYLYHPLGAKMATRPLSMAAARSGDPHGSRNHAP
jgi:hypothetical protein